MAAAAAVLVADLTLGATSVHLTVSRTLSPKLKLIVTVSLALTYILILTFIFTFILT